MAGLTSLPVLSAVAVAAPADRSCAELAKLTLLRELNLSQNKALSDNGLRLLAAGLGDCLCSLNLSYTSVTDDSVVTLVGMKVGGWRRVRSGMRSEGRGRMQHRGNSTCSGVSRFVCSKHWQLQGLLVFVCPVIPC
jgi:hypothetical protein